MTTSPAIKPPLPPGPRTSYLRLATFRELRADPLAYLTRVTRKYGDICTFKTIGQRYVILNHPDLVREVLLTQAEAFLKGPALQNSKGILGEGLLTAEGEIHKQQRRLITPSFHASHVDSYAPDFLSATQMLLADWQARTATGPFVTDIRPHMMGLTLIIAARTLFGTAIPPADIDTVHRCMDVLMGNYRRAVVPWGKYLNFLPLPSTFRLARARRGLFNLIDRIIHERRSAPPDSQDTMPRTQDLLSTMIAATDAEPAEPSAPGCPFHASKGGTRLSDRQLRDHCITILTAGHETTANALTFTLYLLAQHPAEQGRLRTLLTATPNDPVAIESACRNILSESMRLLPPAWTLGRQNRRELVLGGYTIPSKCTILIPQWTLHRDPRFWPNPDAFEPDRWLAPTHPRFAYIPFSTGPRNCIGESFAWREMLLVLPELLRQFTFTLPENAPPLSLIPAITLRPRHAIQLIITPC